MTDKITIERETVERAADALVLMLQWACDPTKASPGYKPLHEAIDALRAALAAQPAEPVACLIRYRSCTPARVAHDKHVHWHDWSKWDIATLAHGKAVTDPSRNPTEDSEWQMQPLYAAPPAPAAVPLTEEWAADVLGIPRTELSVSEFSTYQRERIACVLTGARAVLAAGDKP